MSEFTRILSAVAQGDSHAATQLLPLVYDELRKLAAHKMAQETPDQTGQDRSWENRGHFFAAAAEAMRRILVERARHKKSVKAGGGRERLNLDGLDVTAPGADDDVLALHEALDKLAAKDPRKAELIKLRYFAGLTNEQAAAALGISTSTADNDWAYARAWLRLELQREPPGEPA